ncbi:TPA: hypothetical protein N2X54_004864 [Escherichia coli]|nr:hypothetical protein [Escherichia coli]HBA3263759.1 hypothetical protein [Escherichia coli]HCK1113702.1 hypothetical protein [Escherichia coli]HCK1642655.1 hypothetical protein [Escherichia coli]HCL7557719.1 hypothetical protein [Escherichia coli]
MKKTILTIAILTASAFANAEYMIKIPLEKAGGGALPDGSIQIVKNQPAPAPEHESDDLLISFTSEITSSNCDEIREQNASGSGSFGNCSLSGRYLSQGIPLESWYTPVFGFYFVGLPEFDTNAIARIEVNGVSCVPNWRGQYNVNCAEVMIDESDVGKIINVKVYK